eukprot:10584067-Karenia_brevis.AAC.1
MDGWMDGRMDEWLDGWLDACWMDRWMMDDHHHCLQHHHCKHHKHHLNFETAFAHRGSHLDSSASCPQPARQRPRLKVAIRQAAVA